MPLPDGTNISAHMVVGSGASLTLEENGVMQPIRSGGGE